MKTIALIIPLLCGVLLSATSTAARSDEVTYGFDFQITYDGYRGPLTGPLFTSGTSGSGTATFMYQPGSLAVDNSYAMMPFNVTIFLGGYSLNLIDSSVLGEYHRRGIIVQDIPLEGVTYDTVLFEGFSGPIQVPDDQGNLVVRDLHTQLGLFSLSNAINDNALSEANVMAISNSLVWTTFEIKDKSFAGQVSGSISNFHLLPTSPVPEPSQWLLNIVGLAILVVARRRAASGRRAL